MCHARWRDMILNTVHSRIALLGHDGIRMACNSRLVHWSASGTRGHLVELGNVQLVKLSGTHIEIAVHRIDYLIELGFERSGDGVHGAVGVEGKHGAREYSSDTTQKVVFWRNRKKSLWHIESAHWAAKQ